MSPTPKAILRPRPWVRVTLTLAALVATATPFATSPATAAEPSSSPTSSTYSPTITSVRATSFGAAVSALPSGGAMRITWVRDGVAQTSTTRSTSWWSGTQTGWSNAQVQVLGSGGEVLATSAVVSPPTATPTPAPTTPTPTATPATAGADTPGSQRYPVPAGAIVIGPRDNVQAAVNAAAYSGRATTVVLRGGTYHQGGIYVPPGAPVTIQPYPGEAVWFDGARVLTGFAPDRGRYSAPYAYDFDASVGYKVGAVDGTEPGWQWLAPERPMAAHPDQVFVDGKALREVASVEQVVPGTFYVDHAADKLVLGENPTGRTVEISDLQWAFSVRNDTAVIKGIGFRRYAPSIPDFGVVTAWATGVTFEQLTVTDSATAGIAFLRTNGKLLRSTVLRSGLLGVQGNEADGLVLDGVRIEDANTEGFNHAPVAGGAKFAHTRGFTMRNSRIARPGGNGLWLDEAVFDATIVNNTVTAAAAHGIVLELSSKAVVADNLVTGAAFDALHVRNTDDVQIWNNTLQGAQRGLELSMDSRRPWNNRGAADVRYPNDPEMIWVLRDITVRNNVLAGGPDGRMTLGVEDWSVPEKVGDPNYQKLRATEAGISADSDVYAPPSATSPTWLAAWTNGAKDPDVHTTLASFTAVNGQEARGYAAVGAPVLLADGTPNPVPQSLADARATPLPDAVARVVGKPAGTRHIGVF